MTFEEYQFTAAKTAIYPDRMKTGGLAYTALGLNGEAGEVAEHVKKMIRDNNGILTEDRATKLRKEIGDVLWYLAETATQAGFSLGEIARENNDKLKARMENNTIKGEGDDR